MIPEAHPEDVVRRRSPPVSWPDGINAPITMNEWILAFLLGLGSQLSVRFIGYFKMSEIACIFLLPILLPRISRGGVFKRLGPIMPLLALWLVGVLASDLFHATRIDLSLRGIARVVTIAVCTPVMTYFLQKGLYSKAVAMGLGGIPGLYISAYAFRSGATAGRELVTGSASINWETHWTGLAMKAIGVVGLLL